MHDNFQFQDNLVLSQCYDKTWATLALLVGSCNTDVGSHDDNWYITNVTLYVGDIKASSCGI